MRIITLLFALFLLATPASATPPQAVEVSETLLGVNDTHLFVLRRLDDNLGRYQPTQTDIILIARNRKTNADDQTWPVMRMIEIVEYFGGDNLTRQTKPLPMAGRVNPFDILLSRKAQPLIAPQPGALDQHTGVAHGNDTFGMTADDMYFELTDKVTAGLIRDSLNATRTAVPPYFTEGGDMLVDVEINPAQECTYSNFMRLTDYTGQPEPQISWIAAVTCESDYTMSQITLFLTIPEMQ